MNREQFNKLPKWAQKEVSNLIREREMAIRTLNAYVDNQTVSEIYTDDYVCTGENKGGTCKRQYVQGHKLTFDHAGVELDVAVYDGDVINITWRASGAFGNTVDVAFVPKSYQSANLIAKEKMR
jgi:hypothetical protein